MTVAALVLLAVGLAAVTLSALGILLCRDPYLQLHFLAPASVIGAPAVIVALMLVGAHPGRSTAKLGIILALLLLTAPAITAATARARAQADGLADEDSPQ
ncbi:MAG: monovalent cation/H(+) antiporter subunit G [Mycobacteriales bacterium]